MDISEVQIKFFEQGVRGWSADPFPREDFPGPYRNVHVVSLEPAAVRGNHAHLNQTECLFLIGGRVLFAVAQSTNDEVKLREFSKGPVLLKIPPTVYHAIKNIDSCPIYILAFSDQDFDQTRRDLLRRTLL